jgi:RNA polymerase sigma-70 factor, ECF subfamily
VTGAAELTNHNKTGITKMSDEPVVIRNIIDPLNDTELVIAAKAGSNEAFATLQRRYRAPLYRKLFSITRNREDAEDALQDAFLNAYMALGRFEGRAKFSSWLTQIAINSALMLLRKRRGRGDMNSGRVFQADDDRIYFDIADSAPNPEQVYEQHQRRLQLFKAIQNLDPKFRAVIQIQASQECSIHEVARTLNVSVSAAKTRLHRGRMRLRRSLERRHQYL